LSWFCFDVLVVPAANLELLSDAWLKVTTVDPLVDSDDSDEDEYARHEYSK
jgi:hypothetical protein